MKTIGLIGGMNWESSLEYYRIINETVNEKMGGFHSAKSIMYSIDFEEIEILQRQKKWEDMTALIIEAAKNVEKGGAAFIIICANMIHFMIENIQNNINIPILHIADATASQIKKKGFKKVGLLGTKFTMEQDFYKDRLSAYSIDTVIPNEKERQIINGIIYNELLFENASFNSKNEIKKIIERIASNGAEGIILGSTELPFLIKQKDVETPLFNTAKIHAQSAVEYAITEQENPYVFYY